MIVHDPSNPYAGKIDDELVLTLSDWYHTEMPNLIPGFLDIKANPEGVWTQLAKDLLTRSTQHPPHSNTL